MSLVDPSPEMYDRVLGLRVVRAFSDEPIPSVEMAALLEAARWTGSSKNTQGWEFIVVEGDHLAALAEAGSYTDPLRNSAATIALVQTPDGNQFDIGRAAQNIMLAAAARGIGSCPITLHHDERVAEVLGLPDGYSCRYAIAIGYASDEGELRMRRARRSGGKGGRRPVEDLTHRQSYGN